MEPVLLAMILVLAVCAVITAVKAVCLHLTRSRLLAEEQPFTVYASVRAPEEAEYVVRSALERVKWLDLYGMCRVICLNESGDPEVEAVLRRLTLKYPFAEIGKTAPPDPYRIPE